MRVGVIRGKQNLGVNRIMGMLILWLYDVIKGTLNLRNACCYFVQNRLSSHCLLKNVKFIKYAEYTFGCSVMWL